MNFEIRNFLFSYNRKRSGESRAIVLHILSVEFDLNFSKVGTSSTELEQYRDKYLLAQSKKYFQGL